MIIIILTLTACNNAQHSISPQNKTDINIASTSKINPFDPSFIGYSDFTSIEYPDVDIAYVYNNKIWLFNPKTQERTELIEGNAGIISPDKTKLVYETKTNNDKIAYRILDLRTHKKLDVIEFDEYTSYIHRWSPNGEWFILNTSINNVTNESYIIDSNTGKILYKFRTRLYSSWGWLNETTVAFTNKDKHNNLNPENSDRGYSISTYDLKTNQLTFIKEATDREDYLLDEIHYKQMLITHRASDTSADWANFEFNVSYILLDDKNNVIQENKNKPEGYGIINRQFIESLPLSSDNCFFDIQLLNTNPDWALITAIRRNNTNNLDSSIWIMNIHDYKSIKKVADGRSAHW